MAAHKMAAVKVTPPNDFPLGLIRSRMVVIHLFLMLCDLQRVVRDLYPTLYIHPDGGRHQRTANTLKMEATSHFDWAESICQLDSTDLKIKVESAYGTSALTNGAAYTLKTRKASFSKRQYLSAGLQRRERRSSKPPMKCQ
jgi:hypothetical protein